MDIRQLEYFRAAAKSGSFSAASKTMYVTPQTISAAVALLENELGLPLFDRCTTGITLTDFGEKALLHAEGIVEAASDLKMLALDCRHAWEGSVSFAYASASIPQEGPGLSLSRLMDFSNEHPQVNLRVFESSSDACLAALEHRTADIAFVAGKPDGSKFDMVRAAEARFFIAVSEGHSLARMESIGFEDLEGVVFFPPPDLNYSVRAISEACERKGFSPRFALAAFSVENAREFVRSGRGVDFAPEHLARNDKTPGIVYRPLASRDDISIGLYLARLATDEGKPAARLLWSYIGSLCNL